MSHIYTGIWKEYLPGTTRHHLTVTDGTAFIIMTVVSLLIAFALQSCWSALYLLLRPLLPQNLRSLRKLGKQNYVGAFTVFISFTKVFLKERRALQRWWPSVLIFSTSGLFVLAAFGIPIGAALGLTYGTQEVPPVRTSGSICQFWIGRDRTATVLRNTNLTIAASEYFQACYLQHTPVSCQSNMAQDRLYWTDTDASCPFNASVCVNTGTEANVRLETPFITVNELGINAPTKLQLKRAMTCSVLNTESFQEPPRQGLENVAFTLAFGTHENYEYDVRNLSMVAPGYRLTTIPQTASSPESLDSSLSVPGGFVTVVLLQAPDVYFPEPVDDPMFSAHQEHLFAASGLRWSADNLVAIAGCVDQYMICNNATGVCSPWESPEDMPTISDHEPLIDSDADQHAWNILQYVLTSTSLQYTIAGRGASALAAQRSMNSQTQEKLSPRPWRDELNTWFGVSLAKLQLSVLSIAHPTPFLSTDAFVAFPSDSGTRQLCKMIKSREGQYTNIHWPGFIATLVVCCLVGSACELFRIWKINPSLAGVLGPQNSGLQLVNKPTGPGQNPLPLPSPNTSSQTSLVQLPNATPPAGPTPTSPTSTPLMQPGQPAPAPSQPHSPSPVSSPSPSPPPTPPSPGTPLVQSPPPVQSPSPSTPPTVPLPQPVAASAAAAPQTTV